MYSIRMLSRFSSSTVLLVVLCGVLFLDGLDVSMVGVALPSIEADLHLTTSQLQWIVSGYVLGRFRESPDDVERLLHEAADEVERLVEEMY